MGQLKFTIPWWRFSIYPWPAALLLPATLLFFSLDQHLANVSGGHDSPDYIDVTCRMASVAMPFVTIMFIGSVLWIATLGWWLMQLTKSRKPNLRGLAWLILGIFSHPWILGIFWEAVEKRIIPE